MENYFSQIDWNRPGAQDEFKKQEDMKRQLNMVAQMGKATQGNQAIQNALLSQYMGILMPDQQQQGQDQMAMAMDLLSTQDPDAQQAGLQMLKGNPLLEQYFNKQQQPDNSQSALNDVFGEQAQTDFSINASNPQDAERNAQILSMVGKRPELASQYYTGDPDAGQWMGGLAEGVREIPWYMKAAPALTGLSTIGSLFGARDRAQRKNIFGV